MNVTDHDLTQAERAELDAAMAVVDEDGARNVTRHAFRVAIYHRRTGDASALVKLAESMVFSMWCQRQPWWQEATADLPDGCRTVPLEELIARAEGRRAPTHDMQGVD